MTSIMHIAYNAKSSGNLHVLRESEPGHIRLLYSVDDAELHLLNGVSRKLHVVHTATHMDELLAAQKKVSDAVRVYMARIHKQVLPDNIA